MKAVSVSCREPWKMDCGRLSWQCPVEPGPGEVKLACMSMCLNWKRNRKGHFSKCCSPQACFVALLLCVLNLSPRLPAAPLTPLCRHFIGCDLILRTLPFFPLLKELGALNSLTCAPVICLPLQSSSCNNVASCCQGRFQPQRRPRRAISSDGNVANLRRAHMAKMKSSRASADEERLSNIPVLWFHVMCAPGRGKS